VSADNISVSGSTETGIDGLCRILFDPGDMVAVEEPGFSGARCALKLAGAKLLSVPLDDQGLSVSYLKEHGENVRLVYITPLHDPTGIVMSLERRHELLNWAFETGCIIVEDGFDNELNFGAQPPPLFALDMHGVVAFRSNFWRTLYPMVRLGFLVVPPKLAQLVRQLKAMIDRDVPELEQRALGYFLTEGHFERHVKRLRALYGRRRAALLRALTREFGADVDLPATSSGMHICVKFSAAFDDALVEKAGTEAGLGLVATNHYYEGDPHANEFLIDFAHTTEELFDKRISIFANELRSS
jgi:GntR family transcriptional regulator/MocR family aminotransferase